MEIIRFNNTLDLYLVSIYVVNPNVIGLIFENELPASYLNGFTQINIGNGTMEGDYLSFTTKYRDYENDPLRIELSNDGSVYIPPVVIEPNPEEPYIPTLDEVKTSKHLEVGSVCQSIIFAGIDVELSSGDTKHFTLTYEDQINLIGKQLQVVNGEENIEYHPSSTPTSPCVYYTNADMLKIINTAFSFKSYHTTYCNSLYTWIDNCETTEEVENIYYGVEIPQEYQSEVLKDYIESSMSSTQSN